MILHTQSIDRFYYVAKIRPAVTDIYMYMSSFVMSNNEKNKTGMVFVISYSLVFLESIKANLSLPSLLLLLPIDFSSTSSISYLTEDYDLINK